MVRIRAHHPFNTVLRRLCAAAGDGLVFSPLAVLHRLVGGPEREALRFALAVFSCALAGLYRVIMHARYGATLGKMFFYLRVIDVSGGPLSWKQALSREAVDIAITLLAVPPCIAGLLAGVERRVLTIGPIDVEGTVPLKPALFAGLLWVACFTMLVWFIANGAAVLINRRRRAIHDQIAHSLVIRY